MPGPFDLVAAMMRSTALQSHVLFAQRQTEASRAQQSRKPEPAAPRRQRMVQAVPSIDGRVIDEYTPLTEAESWHPAPNRKRGTDARQADPGRIDILV